jgi:hypothetical protein
VLQSVLVSRVVHIGGALALALLVACERPIDPEICPAVGAGDLVISELRGEQSDTDNQGSWIEIYNAGGATADLHGLQILVRRIDGSAEGQVFVRRSLTLAPGERAVLSFFADDSRPAHTDYGWYPDFLNSSGEASPLFDTAAVDLLGCGGLRIDRVVVDDLPPAGTWSLGVEPPDANANNEDASWCADVTDDADPMTLGLPGTPGASNTPCPPPT